MRLWRDGVDLFERQEPLDVEARRAYSLTLQRLARADLENNEYEYGISRLFRSISVLEAIPAVDLQRFAFDLISPRLALARAMRHIQHNSEAQSQFENALRLVRQYPNFENRDVLLASLLADAAHLSESMQTRPRWLFALRDAWTKFHDEEQFEAAQQVYGSMVYLLDHSGDDPVLRPFREQLLQQTSSIDGAGRYRPLPTGSG